MTDANSDPDDVNYQRQNGYTKLHDAARDGHLDKCKNLLDLGAGLDIKTMSGYTALHLAASNGKS